MFVEFQGDPWSIYLIQSHVGFCLVGDRLSTIWHILGLHAKAKKNISSQEAAKKKKVKQNEAAREKLLSKEVIQVAGKTRYRI